MALDLQKFLTRFVSEARDQLGYLEAGLSSLASGVALEPGATDALFRAAHTLKGSARMLKLAGIAETAHQLEEVLSALRDGRIEARPELGTLLLRALDAIAALVEQVEPGAGQIPPADPALCAALAAAAHGSPSGHSLAPSGQDPDPASAVPEQTPAPAEGALLASGSRPSTATTLTQTKHDSARVRLDKLDVLIQLMGEIIANQPRFQSQLRALASLERSLAAARTHEGMPQASERLDAAREGLRRLRRDLRDLVQEQEQTLNALKEQTLALRLLPLSLIFDPLPSLARALGRELGKEVHCAISGAEIELDRQVIDRLEQVLVHLVRNAIDHGIETPEARLAAGKARLGHLQIAARQEGGMVCIEVEDDGQGLDRERIIAKAVQRGMIEPGRAERLDDAAIAEIILQPGFSTSPILTDISGRGIGLDVVRRILSDELRGTLKVESYPGAWTRFSLRLPVAVAMMRILIFQAGNQTLGLTAYQIQAILRIDEGQVLRIDNHPVVLVEQEFVPLVSLIELLGQPAPPLPAAPRLALLIQSSGSLLGVLVDRLLDERDLLIHPLPPLLQGNRLLAGLVVAGDESVVSLLHAPALIERARRSQGMRAASAQAPALAAPHILVVDDSLNTREIEREILESQGFRVTLAEDGLIGWQKALGERFDAVVTDLDMPGLDGFALTERLRAHEQYRHTPIVMVTARQEPADKQRGIEVGADAYIIKGNFNQSSLVDTLRNLLGWA